MKLRGLPQRVVAAARLVVALLGISPPIHAQFLPTAPGSYDYSDTQNWQGGAINGRFEQSPTGAQTVTVGANTTIGSGPLVQLGAASTLTLRSAGTGDRTLTITGNVSVKGASGTEVFVGSSAAGQGLLLALAAGTRTFEVGAGNTLTIVNAISGAANLSKTGTGTLLLNGANTYSGGTSVTAGSLIVTNATGSGTGTGAVSVANGALLSIGAGPFATTGFVSGSIANDGAVSFSRGDTISYGGVISGLGSVTQSGEGTLVFTGSHSYTGGTTVNSGTLAIGANNTLPTYGTVTVGAEAALAVDNNQSLAGLAGFGNVAIASGKSLTYKYTSLANPDQTNAGLAYALFEGTLTGAGKLVVDGTGMLELTGSNTYTGGTSLQGGILRVSSDGNLGATNAGVSFSGGTLQLAAAFSSARSLDLQAAGGAIDDGGNPGTLTGVISGAGPLKLTGGGQLTLTGNNTYAGGTVVESGSKVVVAADSNLGNPGGVLTLSGGTLQTTASLGTFSREISVGPSAGWIDTNGFDSTYAGKLTGTGEFVKTGAGVLTLTGTTNDYSNHTNIYGGTLRLGATNTLPTATVLYSTADGTLDVAANQTVGLLLGTGSINLGASRVLTISGANSGTYSGNISGNGGLALSNGAYVQLTGSNTQLAGTNIDTTSTLVVGDGENSGSINTRIANNGGLIFSRKGKVTFADVISGSGYVNFSGGGEYTLSGSNTYGGWTYIDGNSTLVVGASNSLPASTVISFSSATGTLQVGQNQTVGGLSAWSPDSQVAIAAGRTFTVNPNEGEGGGFVGVISGNGSFVKDGKGYLYLLGDNTYAGGTTVRDGTLYLGNHNAGYNGSITGNITIESQGTLVAARPVDMTISGLISGSGSLMGAGAGVLTLSGNNTFTGNTTINYNSTLAISASNNLGVSSAGLILYAGTLRTAAAIPDFAHPINLLTYGGAVDTHGFDSVFSGRITGDGELDKVGPGTLTLTGTANDYTGRTVVDAGTLRLGAANTLPTATVLYSAAGGTLDVAANQTVAQLHGSGAVTLGSGRTLTVSGANSGTYSGNITGAGSLAVANGAWLELAGANSYSGGTFIGDNSQLVVGGNETSSPLNGNVNDNGGLLFGRAGNLTYHGNISGSGFVRFAGTGNYTLTGNNTYAGSTYIDGDTALVVGAANTLPQSTGIFFNGSTGALKVNFDQTVGSLDAWSGNSTVTIGGNRTLTVNQQDGSRYFYGKLDGAGALVKTGAGTWVLRGDNSHSGGTAIEGGVLRVGNGSLEAPAGSISGNVSVAMGAQLAIDRPDGYVFNGSISGAGSVFLEPSAQLTLGGNNTYSGGTLVNYSGTLSILSAANAGTGAVTLWHGTLRTLAGLSDFNREVIFGYSGGTVDTNGFDSSFSGPMGGDYDLIKAGAGMLTLTGSGKTLSGRAVVSAGTLRLASVDVLPHSAALVAESGGTLRISANQTAAALNGTGQVILDPGKTLTFAGGWAGAFYGSISGAGALAISDGAHFRLGGANNYTGGTAVGSGAILDVGDGETGGSIVGSVRNDGQLAFVTPGNTTYAGDITGTGYVTFNGAGTLHLTGASTYAGQTILYGSGSLSVDTANALPVATDFTIYDQGTLALHANQTLRSLSGYTSSHVSLASGTVLNLAPPAETGTSFDGVIAGSGSLVKSGSGYLYLNNGNTFTGGTTVAGGQLILAGSASNGTIAGNVAISQGAMLVFQQPYDQTFVGDISGSGTVAVSGPGVVTLTGNNTQSGGTRVEWGSTLNVTADAALGAASAPLTLYGGTLRTGVALAAFGRSLAIENHGVIDTNGFDSVFTGELTGVATLDKSGAGVLTLTNPASALSGWLYVQGGSLRIGAPLALSGAGVSVENAGTLEVAQNLTVNGLTGGGAVTLGSGATLTRQSYDYSQFRGTITGPGALSVPADSAFTLTGYASHTGGTFNAGSLQVGDGGTGGLISGDIVNNGQLTFWRSGSSTLGSVISGTGDLGLSGGTFTLSAANTYSGSTYLFPNTQVIIGVNNALPTATNLSLYLAASLAVNHNQTIGHLDAWNQDTQISLGSGATLTIAHPNDQHTSSLYGPISGQGGLAFTGGGTLILGSPATHAGGTTVTAGLLQFESSGSVSGGITLADDARVVFNRNDLQTYAGVISGQGGIDIMGGGTVRLTSPNTYSGPTHLNFGTLKIGTAGALPAATELHMQSGTLDVEQSQTVAGLHGYGSINLAAGRTLTVNAPDQSYGAYSGVISGAGAFTKSGSGDLYIGGVNSFTGALTISGGRLSLDLTTGGSMPAGNIANQGQLEIWNNTTASYAGLITGAGHLAINGVGALVLTSDSAFSGHVSLADSVLQFGNGGSAGSLAASDYYLGDGSSLVFRRSDSFVFSASLSGNGVLAQEGTGSLTLTGAGQIDGGVTVASGTLVVGADGALSHSHVNVFSGGFLQVSANTILDGLTGLGTTTIDAGKTLTLGGTQLIQAPVTGTGAVAIDGTITVSTNLAYTGGTTVSAYGNLILGNGGSSGSVTGSIYLADCGSRVTFSRSDNFTQSAAITGYGGVTQNGGGTLTLSGANTYTGPTAVQMGTLAGSGAGAYSADSVFFVNAGATLRLNSSHSLAGLMDFQPGVGGLVSLGNSTTLTVVGSGSYTFSGAIAGAGSLVKAGTGTLTLAGNNTYTGTTTVTSGLLMLGSGGSAGSVAGGITNNGTLLFNRSDLFTFSGTISGTGSVQQGTIIGGALPATTGTTVLTGTNTYSGGTVVNSGTLIVGSAGALGSGSVSLNGGALRLAPGVALSNALDFGAEGGTLAGNGTIAIPITAGPKITLSPGDSPGTLTFANSLTWAGGGSYTVEIASAAGNTPGVSFDTVVVSGGAFNITANSATPFNVRLASLDLSFNAGMVSDFNPLNTYSWQIASSATAITGFSASAFAIDKSSFQNPIGDGQFYLTLGGTGGNTAIYLNFKPVPEPSTWALLVTGLAALAFCARRRRA